jgi:predicted component of type VI protein secretion system
MTAHKNISGKHPLSDEDILQAVYRVCFSPSGEINRDGVDALITTLDRRISDLLDEIIHFCEFQQSASHWQRVLH